VVILRACLPILFFAGLAMGQGIASRSVTSAPRAKSSGKPWTAHFTDAGRALGLTAPTVYGNDARIDYLVESSSGGIAFIDYDNDGFADLFIASGTRFGDAPPETTNRLYHNEGGKRFVDVTEKAGLRRAGWGSGVAVGDFDHDGFDDLFVTYWGHDVLYRNKGDGTFEDVTARVGLARKEVRWSAGATFIDYNRDGNLDLFVSTYMEFDPATTPKPGFNAFCNWKGLAVACGPRGQPASRHYLYRNDHGKFTDVSVSAGITKTQKTFGLTAVAADFDDDGWPDIYVASDSTPSLFFHNKHNGTFAEEALERGVALNEDGREQAGMGLAIGDFNLNGYLDIFKTHFADDTPVLYSNNGHGEFRDVTLTAGLGVEARYVGWGTVFADFDNDGWPDLFVVTGHVYPDAEKKLPAYPYRTPRLLFRNLGAGRFEQILDEPEVNRAFSSRGLAAADFDNDGDIDLVIWNRNEPPTLLRNDLASTNRWLQVEAPTGTRVTAGYGGRRQAQEVLSQSSFFSSNGRVLHFGLGAATSADLEIRWPDGRREVRRAVPAGRRLKLVSPGKL
jgi:hypothetical protein